MNYESFTRDQIESALKALKIENSLLLKTNSELKKEIKSLKLQCSTFESVCLREIPVARRQTIH